MDIGWGLGSYSGNIVYFVLFKEYIWGLIQLFDDQARKTSHQESRQAATMKVWNNRCLTDTTSSFLRNKNSVILLCSLLLLMDGFLFSRRQRQDRELYNSK